MKTPAELEAAVRGYQSGNREEFDSVYQLSHRYLYVCISHLVKDEDTAKDMLQETYLEITRSISQLHNPADFLSWAAVIAKRRCYAFFQKEDRFVLSGEGEDGQDFIDSVADDEAFIPESILQDMEKRRLIREIIDGLSDMQRLCVIAYYYNEQKQEEIAEELGIPVNTVKSHLSRAKSKIKEEVLTLEREKDTKLYTLAPFMLLFLAKEVEACEAVPMSEEPEAAVKRNNLKEDNENGTSKLGTLAKLSMKTKFLIGLAVIVGIASVIGAVVFRSAAGTQEEPEGQAQPEKTQTADGEEENPAENVEAESGDNGKQEEEAQGVTELAISGVYDAMGMGKDGRIVVNSGGKWGLVTYDNQVIVPLEYDFTCTAPNDDGQTFFGNVGDFRVFDRDGNEIFQTDKPIKAVSDGIVLWVQTEGDMMYHFGYVKLDGTTLFEPDDQDIDMQVGAVGFNEGYAFSSSGEKGTEYRIARDGTVVDIFKEREALRHSKLPDGQTVSSTVEFNGTSDDINLYYPIGACYAGYYVDEGISLWEDTSGTLYVNDVEGKEQYLLSMESVVAHAGYSWGEDVQWSIRRFYHNGNYCCNNGTKISVYVLNGEEQRAYLLDVTKLEVSTDGVRPQTVLTDESILAEGDYVGIADTAYWLIRRDGQWGYIDQDGRVVQMFDDAAQFYGGKAMVVEDGYAFFIDEDMNLSEWKIPAQSVRGYGEVFAVTTEDGQKCYVAE